MKVVHVITSLKTGGAEVMLLRLLQQLAGSAYEPHVIGLSTPGDVSAALDNMGIPTYALGSRKGVPDPSVVLAVAKIMRRVRPDVVQTWMYHSDLIGAMAARIAGNPPVAWGLHHSNLSPAFIKRSTLWTAKACARLSYHLPAAVVCCAESTRQLHARFGYDEQKLLVIPNGFDLDVFRPDPVARAEIRRELGIGDETPLIGMLARFHPQKDHRNFVRAARVIRAQRDDAHFLLCGFGMEWSNPELVTWIDEAGLRDRIHLLSRRPDANRVQASLDVACLSSQGGEAMPLTIGEAMACGVPCAVTDVGDAALLVGDTGRVAKPRDPDGLAAACLSLLSLSGEGRTLAGRSARARIAERYSLASVAAEYARLHERLAIRTELCPA